MLDGLKEAIQFLIKEGENKPLFKEINGMTYSNVGLSRVGVYKAEPITATTLTSIIDYIKSGYDRKASENLIIHVISPRIVSVYSELLGAREREEYIKSTALLPEIKYGKFLNVEDFNIMLQSNFVRNDVAAGLLKVLGNVTETTEANSVDDGVSQKVIMRTGVSTVGAAVLPEQIELAPYRTFPEIEQPISRFVFRMDKGPAAAIFEADGGAWRNEAMLRIKDYLKEQLKDVQGIQIIS